MENEERINVLRKLVRSHLTQPQNMKRINDLLKDTTINESKIADQFIGEIKQDIKSMKKESLLKVVDKPSSGSRHLQVKINHGCAFLDLYSSDTAFLEVSIFFLNKQVRSQTIPFLNEPKFGDIFYFCLDEHEKLVNLEKLSDKLLITAVKIDGSARTLLGCCSIDWRKALLTPRGVSLNEELSSPKCDGGISVGVLNVTLSILPEVKSIPTVKSLDSIRQSENSKNSECDRLFLLYTKDWWSEFLSLRDGHRERHVLLFGEDELGISRPLFTFITRIRSYLIESPSQAARFVSLIPCCDVRNSVNGSGGNVQHWMSIPAFLATRNGPPCSHAALLCSLFLGFGMDAYVCLGSRARGPLQPWVMVVSCKGVTFFEPQNGQRYSPTDNVPYVTVDCAFNDTSFYANIQPSNKIPKVTFELGNPVFWKCLASGSITSVRATPSPPLCIQLRPSVTDPYHLAFQMEREFRRAVREERDDLDLETKFSDELSHLLSPALQAYELERSANVSVSNEDFEQAVRHSVTPGCTFKAFPGQFNQTNTRAIFKQCMRSEICKEVVRVTGEKVRHAVRVKVSVYPEEVIAVWVMIAVQYMCVM